MAKPFVSQQEKSWLAFIEWLANTEIRSTKEVEQRGMQATGLSRAEFGEIEPHRAARYRDDQQRLRERLERITASEKPAPDLVRDLNDFLRKKLSSQLAQGQNGLELRLHPTGVEAIIAAGLALLLDEQRGLRARLRRCRAPGCTQFFFNLDIAWRAREFCEGHRSKYHNQQRKLRTLS